MNLYDIDQRILNLIDPETGEVTDADIFDQLQMERTEKLEAVALAYKNYTAEASILAEQEKAFAERKRKAQKHAEYYRSLLERGLAGERFETPMVAVSYRRSTAVEITDMAALPFTFTTVKIEADKSKITEALKRGEAVEGATLVTRNNIQIK